MRARRAGSRSVLIVDNCEDGATSLADVLEIYGHTVRVAFDAAAALTAVAQARPEVIVVDPWRVAADGAALAGRLAGLAGGRPLLIALTGYVWNRGRLPGFDHTLLKPCDPAALVRLVAGHVRAAPEREPIPPGPAWTCQAARAGTGRAEV